MLSVIEYFAKSLNVIPNDTVEQGVCKSLLQYSIETMSVSRTVYEIFSVKEQRDLETGGRGRSKSLEMAQFDRPCTSSYWSASTNIAELYLVPFLSYLFNVGYGYAGIVDLRALNQIWYKFEAHTIITVKHSEKL